MNEEYKEIQLIAKELQNKLGRSVSEFDDSVLWEEVNKKSTKDGLLKMTYGYSGSDIERGTKVALLKAISSERLTYEVLYSSLRLVGGTATHVERQDILSSSKIIANRKKFNEEGRKNLPSPPEI